MSQKSERGIDDSWIANDIDDGDISWTGESTSSYEDDVKIATPESSPRIAQSVSSEVVFPTFVGPDLIMPSIGETGNQPRQRVTTRKQDVRTTPARDTKSRTISARSTPTRSTPAHSRQPPDSPGIGDHLSTAAENTVGWLLDLIGQTLSWLKTPISLVLAAWLLTGFIMMTWNLFTSSISNAFSPICRVPGVGLLNLPICRSPFGDDQRQLPAGATPEPEFDALMTVQSQFETIMSDTATGVSLPMDMKRSETSIRDLRQVVAFSHLPSRHELMYEFDGFVETARIASYDLQKFNSHVGRGVDIVLSTARWTQRVLDDIDHQQSERGLLPAFISDTLLAPFQPLKFTESRLLDQYIKHTHVISEEIESLIDEAQTLLQVLQNLEDRLEVIHSISLRDNVQIQGTKDEILGQIWTQLGGNRAKKGKVDTQLRLLGRVSEYRKVAFAHVANTIVKLQGMGAELEELRTRVGSAEALRDAGVRHVPLSVHIENIQLGVERLEIGRERAREVERGHTRRVLDNAEHLEAARDIKYLSSS